MGAIPRQNDQKNRKNKQPRRHNRYDELTAFLDFPPESRKLVWMTDLIENRNRKRGKVPVEVILPAR